jgi:hypothetical protein
MPISSLGCWNFFVNIGFDIGLLMQGDISGMMELESGHLSSHVLGGSSSRKVVISSSKRTTSIEVLDFSQTLSNKVGITVSLHTS